MTKNSSRRAFLAGSAAVATAVAAGAASASGNNRSQKIADLKDVKPGQALDFSYPEDEIAYLIDLGRKVPGGVGPKGSIVAFSGLCQHMGCALDYNKDKGLFVCPCHASVFDPQRNGLCIEGPSTRGLPRISLNVDGSAVYATGVENEVVYGRACNSA